MTLEQRSPKRGVDAWLWALVGLATAALIGLAVAGERSGSTDQPLSGKRGQSGPRPAQREVIAMSLPLVGGGRASIRPGKLTVVDFWATWCAPCRQSMPRVQKLYTEYRPRGVELYSVDTDEPDPEREPNVQTFLRSFALTFPVVLDDGRASRLFDVRVIPTVLLLDAQGGVLWRHRGAVDDGVERDLRATIDRALAGG